jgi:hypothetical protein
MNTFLPFVELLHILIKTLPAFSLNFEHIIQSFPKVQVIKSTSVQCAQKQIAIKGTHEKINKNTSKIANEKTAKLDRENTYL